MREYGTAVEAHLASQQGVFVRHLIWIEAKNRSTGATEAGGFWDGDDVRTFTINGQSRQYAGAGALLGISPITSTVGIEVRTHTISLSGLTDEVLAAVRGFDVRLAPVEIHRAFFDPQKGVLIGNPIRILKGVVDQAPIPRAAQDGSETLELTILSASQALTRRLTAKKSDAMQKAINPADKGREYSAAIAGVFWGVRSARGVPPPTQPAPSAPAPLDFESEPDRR